MAGEDLRKRTRQFGLQVIHLVESLPRRRTADILGGQLLRAGTSVGANYRAACRAKSPADFISKMGTVEEELDESMYWLEMLIEGRIVLSDVVDGLMRECDELLAITVSSIKTARGKRRTRGEAARAAGRNSAFRTPHSALGRGGCYGDLG